MTIKQVIPLMRKRRSDKASGSGAQIESEDEDKYRPIQWPLIRQLLRELRPYRWL